jgi:hypothetical protein
MERATIVVHILDSILVVSLMFGDFVLSQNASRSVLKTRFFLQIFQKILGLIFEFEFGASLTNFNA